MLRIPLASRVMAWLLPGLGILLSTTVLQAQSGMPGAVPASRSNLVALDTGTWTENLPAPRARSKQAAVYDSHRNRMIMFGGKCQDACCPDGPVGTDTWMLNLDSAVPAWVQVYPGGTLPGPSLGPAGIYDPVRDRMLVPGATGHVWALSLAGSPQWGELAVTGTGPSPSAPTAVYDPVRDQMVVVTSTGAWTFSLPGSQWTQLAPTGKAPTGVNSACYDPVRDRIVVFGDSVRVLSLAGSPAWSALTNNRMPRAHTVIYDPVRDRAVLHGGCQGSGCGTTETWALALSGAPGWTQLSASGPLLSYHSAIYDPSHDRMVVFGGYANQFYYDWSMRELWTMTLGAVPQWTDVTPPNPPRACGIPAVRDPVRNRMITFDDSVRVTSLTGLPTWSALPATGPAPRSGYSILHDPIRDRVLLFGGWVWNGVARQQLSDLWSLTLSGPVAWTQLAPTGVPPVTSGHAVYDPVRDRMLEVGPQRVWSLGLAEPMGWSELAPSGAAPPVDSGCTAVYDPARDRVLVFGGGGAGGLVNGTWELGLSPVPAWNALAPSGAAPPARAGHVAIYDPPRDRMLVAGGNTGGASPATDTWALTLAPSPAWLQLSTVGSARGLAAVYDPVFDRMGTVGTGAEASSGACPEPEPGMWSLWLGTAPVLAAPPATARLSLAQSLPNPGRGGVSIPFSLGRPGVVSLSVYDVSGRTVRVLFEGVLPAGSHVVRWDATRTDGSAARPGAYFYELRASGERVTRRLLLLR